MTLGEMQHFFVQEGMKADSRKKARLTQVLNAARAEYRKCPVSRKRFFDQERLTNPYADSRILFGGESCPVRRMLVGIDIGVGEILLADRLAQKERAVDVVLAHHPEGPALAGLADVMHLQTDMLAELGVRRDIAEDVMGKRIAEVGRRLHSCNFTRPVDAARLLGIPMMCCHTPADNHVNGYLQGVMDRAKPRSLSRVLDLLLKEPEYREAAARQAGPEILAGKPEDPAGRILVDMTGGTEGSKDIFARLSQIGVDTLLCMHLSEAHLEKIKPEHIKVVNAGHMASDNLGLNLLLDKLARRAEVDILECSGFRRFRR